MSKYFIGILLTALCLCNTISAQDAAVSNNEAHASITQTIEMYFEGWMTGDTSKLGQAMHPTCHLKLIRDDKMRDVDRATYLSFFKPGPRRENSEGRIISMDITGPVASAKCELEIPGRIYTDYFNLMKLNDWWYIVDKISTNVSTE